MSPNYHTAKESLIKMNLSKQSIRAKLGMVLLPDVNGKTVAGIHSKYGSVLSTYQ